MVDLIFFLFKYDWINLNISCKKNKLGFTLVNFLHLAYIGGNLVDDPFVFASQAKKVFYVKAGRKKDWFIVKHAKLSNIYGMGVKSSLVGEQRSGEI